MRFSKAWKIGLVHHSNHRLFAWRGLIHDALLELAPLARLGQQHDDIGTVERTGRFLQTALGEFRAIVQSGGIEKNSRRLIQPPGFYGREIFQRVPCEFHVKAFA